MDGQIFKFPAILCELVGVAPITGSRIASNDPEFPQLKRIGNSKYITEKAFYAWLSVKAGKKVTKYDRILNSKAIAEFYQRSSTWIWQQTKSGDIPKPFKINRNNYWLERDILSNRNGVAK